MADNPAAARFALFATALGSCGIAWRDAVVVATRLPDPREADTAEHLRWRAGATPGTPPPVIQRAIAAMQALLEGERTDLGFIECDFGRLDAFAVGVYAATRAIPAGQTRTYGSIAWQLGDGQLARKVGRTLGRNPFPIIVPCHRVLGADGRLTGFSAAGGVTTKSRMLIIERARIGQEPDLFGDPPLAGP